jgi:hypothetical protein
MSSSSLLAPLADARWLTPERARGYSRLLLVMTALGALIWVALSHDGVDLAGHPLGTDFQSFWAASKLALTGHPASAYDPKAHGTLQQSLFPGHDLDGYTAFFYPPTFLLVCLPLALLPYLASLVVWLGATGYVFWRALRVLLARPGMAVPILAYPAVYLNAGHGQTGFLVGALFAGAAIWLGPRPVLAGVCLGLVCVKPHFGVLIPLALLATRQWRALAAAALATAGFVGLSLLAFGPATWEAFLRATPLARAALDQELVGSAKMVSVFAAARVLGGSAALAYVAQAAAALVAAIGVVARLRGRDAAPDRSGQVALLVVATLCASPFVLDYDLTLLAIPLAWSFQQALLTGFRRWEKLTLASGFMLPMVARLLATHLSLPVGPLVVAAVFVLVARRLRDAGDPAGSPLKIHPPAV